MKLPDKIISLRKANGWSQEALAERMNVSRQAVSRWENGTALPDAQNVWQLSRLFHVTTDYLLNDDCHSDPDDPPVQSTAQETESLRSNRKGLHLIAACCFAVSTLCSLFGAVSSTNTTQLGLACLTAALCAGNAVAQLVLYLKK